MPKVTRSHVDKKGHSYFKHTGRYNEVTVHARHTFDNNAGSASEQTLVVKGNKSAAATTLKKVWKELGY